MIIKKFQEQAGKNADKIAVKTVNREITYGELDRYSQQLTHKLISYNKSKSSGNSIENKIAALLFEHGPDWIISIVAVLKANMIYVPLDITCPKNRLLYMLAHSKTSILITNRKNIHLAETLVEQIDKEIEILLVDDFLLSANQVSELRSEQEALDDQPAYILYTSGSTGKPKGVVQTRKNICYFLEHWTEKFSITRETRMTLLASFSHDGAIPDIFSALFNGAALYLYDIKENPDINDLICWLKEEEINIWHSVPTLYRYFVRSLRDSDFFPQLKLIILGGEEVRKDDILSFKDRFPNARLANIYGQTESTVNSIWVYSPEMPFKKVVLGNPIGNTQLILVDEDGGVVEEMGSGEIVIASNHVAVEYWQDEENSKRVFTEDSDWGRLYWTGDWGRLTAEGEIIFIGRRDYQVKIRGYRVEIAEIETCLLKNPNVKDVVVVANKDKNEDYFLCAYIVSDHHLDRDVLKDSLAKHLPDYMVPQFFTGIEKMPLTPNGKVDRKALPEPGIDLSQANNFSEPVNEIETQIMLIWKEILGKENIGIDSNFFELGGHSLLIISLVSRIHQEFKVKLQLKHVFDNPTVKTLSKVIQHSRQTRFSSIQPAEKRDYYEVSSAQNRLYILQQSEPANTAYHIPGVYLWEGDLNFNRFETAFQQLVNRQELLRSSFCIIDGVTKQRFHPIVDFKILFSTGTEAQAKEKVMTFRRPFDLENPPLFRVELFKVEEKKYFIFFDIHHIISDAFSMQVLINEFKDFYDGKSLKPLKVQYKDFAVWQNRFFYRKEYKVQEQYWLKTLDNFQFTRLPVDKFQPRDQGEGKQKSYILNKEMVEKINRLTRKYSITRFSLMISVFIIVLAREINEKDITIGIPSTHREYDVLKKIIGIFLNVLLIRGKVDVNESFLDFLLKMKRIIIDAITNQDYPYESLYTKIKESSGSKENELFTILFNYFPLENAGEEIFTGESRLTRYSHGNVSSKYDVTFYAQDMQQTLGLNLVYKDNLFSENRMQRLMDNFLIVLKKVLEDEKIKILDTLGENNTNIDDFSSEFDQYYENDEMMSSINV